jgi:cytochrome P450
MVPVINGKLTPSFIAMRDEKFVSTVRRHTSHAFSTTSVLDYESHIDETIGVLTSNLRDAGRTVDLQQWLSFFAFDTICRMAFSDDAGMMNRQQDVGDTLRGGRARFLYWNKWFAYPKLEALLYKNRWTRGIVTQNILTSMAVERVQGRIQEGGKGTHDDLLDRYFQAQEKAPDVFTIPNITAITLSTIHAGSETTGHTLSLVFKDLFKNPKVYDQLKKEVRQADLSSPPTFAEVKKIPFVEACIKESQRVSVFVFIPSERTVPEGGATICGTFIPAGTAVCKFFIGASLNEALLVTSTHDADFHNSHQSTSPLF